MHRDGGLLLDKLKHRVEEARHIKQADCWIIGQGSSGGRVTHLARAQVDLFPLGDLGS